MAVDFRIGTVAFLDILGFADLVRAAEGNTNSRMELDALISMLDEHVTFQTQPPQVIPATQQPRWIFISDSLIISSLDETNNGLDLAAVAVKVAIVTYHIFRMGHLVRGGLSRGFVHQTQTNIFGTAYMEAYDLERTTVWPRIQLSQAAANHWRSHPARTFLPIVGDLDADVVDVFNPTYNAAQRILKNYFDALDTIAVRESTTYPDRSAPRLKWEWCKEFIQRTRGRHNP